MKYKTDEERIGNLEEKIKQLEAQKKQIEARSKERERKERTRKLIQIGAVLDSIGIDTLEKANLLKNNITNSEKANEWFKKLYSENKSEIEKKQG